MTALSPAPFFSGNLFPGAVSHLWDRLLALFALADRAPDRSQDRLLVEEALAGDPGFERLVRAYESLVYRTAFRFMGQEADALDVTQEVFLRVHRSLPKFRGDSALSTWIYAITANLARNALRAKKNRGKFQVLAPASEEGTPQEWLEKAGDGGKNRAAELAEDRAFQKAFQKALAQVPDDFKEALVLRDLEGLDYERIAQVLRLGLGTVKSRIARGRQALRGPLKEWL